MNKMLMMGVATMALLVAQHSVAQQLHIEVFDGASLVDSVTSTTGTVNLSTTDANFSEISFTGVGAPIVADPDLSTVTLNVKSASAGTHTLTIDVFQTGVSALAGSKLASTFTVNDLIGDPGPTTESTFFNGSASTLGTLLQTHTFAVGDLDDHIGPLFNTLGSALTADAQQYVINFTHAGESANDTIELASSAVPEPSTWAMLLSGFGLLAFLGMKRHRTNRLASI
jgi:PEP-CTERM motif